MKKLIWILLSFAAIGGSIYGNAADGIFGGYVHAKNIIVTAGYAVFWGLYMKYNAKHRGMMMYAATLAGGTLITALSALYSITFNAWWRLIYIQMIFFMSPIYGLYAVLDFNTYVAYGVITAVSIGWLALCVVLIKKGRKTDGGNELDEVGEEQQAT